MNNLQRILRVGIYILGLVVIALIGFRIGRMPKTPAPQAEIATYGTVGEFSFVDQAGRSFGLADLKNKTWVADFFFTQCMGPCPLLTTRMAELQREFAAKKGLMFVSFSVDPDHDTPEALAKYAATYGANAATWRFLTGPKEKIYKLVRESFHLAVEPSPPEKPSINDILHSLYFVLVNGQGTVIGYFDTSDPDAMKRLRDALTNS